MLTPISYKNNQPIFGVNLNSPKLKLSQKDFFIKIKGYGRNSFWANEIIKTTDEAVELIRKNVDYENVLLLITQGVRVANRHPFDLYLRKHTGILRVSREGWKYDSEWDNCFLSTPYVNNKYKVYERRFDNVKLNPLNNPYKDIELAKFGFSERMNCKCIFHPASTYVNNVFKHIEKIYNHIQENFIRKEITAKDMPELNNKIAELRWIMAHGTPWERGSDSISNVFMRAIYKAAGVKAYPPAENISYDLEAFCTNLDEYKKNFPNYFEKPPEVIM